MKLGDGGDGFWSLDQEKLSTLAIQIILQTSPPLATMIFSRS